MKVNGVLKGYKASVAEDGVCAEVIRGKTISSLTVYIGETPKTYWCYNILNNFWIKLPKDSYVNAGHNINSPLNKTFTIPKSVWVKFCELKLKGKIN